MSDAEVYLVYCRHNGRVSVLGPVKSTYEEADDEVKNLRRQGWEAFWVGLNAEFRYVVGIEEAVVA